MINAAKRDELMQAFNERVASNVEANVAGMDLVGYCADGDMNVVRSAVTKIEANITASVPEGLPIPKASLYINGTGSGAGENVTVLSLTLTNGWKDPKEFKYALKVPVTDNILDVVVDFLKAAYAELLLDVIAGENLEEVNALLSNVCEKAGVAYKVVVATPLNNTGKLLLSISDTEVVFVADMDRLFDLDDVLVLCKPNELVTEEMIARAQDTMAEEIGLCQTTPQLVGAHGGSLVKYICKIGTQVKAITLIRKVASKNAQRLTGKKDTDAYYENGDTYALVARVDGNFQVILKPFNIKTLMNEDVDVVAALTA